MLGQVLPDTRNSVPEPLSLSRSSSPARLSASCGQARTQAGPPSMPEHMSHLIAFFGVSGSTRFSVHFFGGSPGTGIWQVVFHWAVQYPLLVVGIFLMLLQVIAQFFKDIAEAIGRPIA